MMIRSTRDPAGRADSADTAGNHAAAEPLLAGQGIEGAPLLFDDGRYACVTLIAPPAGPTTSRRKGSHHDPRPQ
ncbi:hypothetical protein AB0M36_12295 [Actinoplanes sp. NPDC051346]|uniref:hypothetical protein n=1 Tax=Actinoplanes sp. NPDC051346 TaxID=3155048 RepID=UPI0034338E3C